MRIPTDDHAGAHCEHCSSPLLHDQRYCLGCGDRRGPLPLTVTELIAAGLRAGGSFPQGAALAAAADHARDQHDEHPLARWLPQPRAAALAVMALLAFGVVVGSVVSPPADSAAPPMVVALQQPAAAAPVTTDQSAAADTPVADTPAPVAAAPAAAAPAAAPTGGDTTPAPPDAPALPDVRHVFLIVLTGHGYDETFGAGSPAPYLSRDLPRQGELLANYYGVAQSELANGIALISGQGPTAQTASNCPQYGDVTPATIDRSGQVAGDGCVYPARAQTLADQLTAGGRTWRAYVEDEASGPAGEARTCRHPAPGTADADQAPRPGDAYVTWRNPFVYFHSLLDTPACAGGDVDLSQLAQDLHSPDTTPTVSYIVPDRCHDGSDEPCAPGAPAGLAAADAFLHTLVPEIEASAGYRDGGVIAITFDQAPQSGPLADPSSCCDQPTFPNLAAGVGTPPATPPTTTGTTTAPTTPTTTTAPTTTTGPTTTTVPATTTTGTTTGSTTTATASAATTPAPASTTPTTPTTPAVPATPPGGGRVGLLLISQFVQPGTIDMTGEYNHFSLLRSIEDLFDLQHLGYAADPALPAFDSVVWNARAH